MSDLNEHKYNCPFCHTELWKWNARTGMYCNVCGTRVREKIDNKEFLSYTENTSGAFTVGFLKGFLLAGFFGIWVGYGLVLGISWGVIWGTYRYFTGTPNSSYGEKYLTFF